MPNLQVLCPYYVKKTHCIDRCVVVSLKFELNESIIKQLIKHLLHTFLTVISIYIKMWLSNKF